VSDEEREEPPKKGEGLKINPGHLTAGSIHISSSGGLSVGPAAAPSTVAGPLTPSSPPFARGGIVYPGGRIEPKPVEHIPMPSKMPTRVLVAFLNEDGDPEPFWAAYLAPHSIQLNVDPRSPEDASMYLELSLVKVFEQ
jgi:hypothetical protein